jgi:uncharacterized protein (UPF0332 family)
MSPEAVDYLSIAQEHLQMAEDALAAGLYRHCVRDTYLVGLSAARAIVFDMTASAPKTHSGTRNQLSKLIHDGLKLDEEYLQFLAVGFEMKADLDYGPVTPVDRSTAEAALNTARRFLAAAKALCGIT